MNVRPFHISITEDQIDDLHDRLARTRWPHVVEGTHWEEGTDSQFLQRLLGYWRNGFDWRLQEARLNALPQFVASVEDLDIHFIHQRSKGQNPFPLIMTHGWPGSFIEMERIIPLLTDPESHGADATDAFDVVVPSLPGYGFSQKPPQAGVGPARIAEIWMKLMHSLGYDRFGAQGGDWGAGVCTWLAFRYPRQVVGIHLNYIPGSYQPPLGDGQPPLSEEEQRYAEVRSMWQQTEGGYGHIQQTKPLTLAYALNDSPAGLAAWISEKFRTWSDCGGEIEQAISLDTLLTNISIYWFSGSISSSMRLYLESQRQPLHFTAGQRVMPPLGVALYPHELPMPPRSWAERVFEVKQWTAMPRGGHFAALETPDLLAEEIRKFFRPYRRNG